MDRLVFCQISLRLEMKSLLCVLSEVLRIELKHDDDIYYFTPNIKRAFTVLHCCRESAICLNYNSLSLSLSLSLCNSKCYYATNMLRID